EPALLHARALDPGHLAVAPAGRDGGIDQAPVLPALGRVAGRGADADREVVGADVDHVDAGHRDDLVDAVDPGRGLDHDAADDVGVGGLDRVLLEHEAAPDRAPAPVAGGGVAAGAGRADGLLGGVDHRDDHALGTGVEGLHDVVGRVPGHADDGGGVGG